MAESIKSKDSESHRLLLWIGPLIGPIAWLGDLQASYTADSSSCRSHSSMPLHIATLLSAGICIAGILITAILWRRNGGTWPDEKEGIVPRSRFLTFVGFGVNLMFLVAILAQAVPKLLLDPCQ